MLNNNQYDKYKDHFVKPDYLGILERLGKEDEFITEWSNNKFNDFIKLLNLTAKMSVDKYFNILTDIYLYICKEENILFKNIYLSYPYEYYLDLEKINSQLISKNEYELIKSKIIETIDGKEYNTRDKLVFELLWEGLLPGEIRNLKKNNIKMQKDKIIIHLENKVVNIDNKEIIDDIDKTLSQKYYYNKKTQKFFEYLDSPYVIKSFTKFNNKNHPSIIINIVNVNIVKRLNINKELGAYGIIASGKEYRGERY